MQYFPQTTIYSVKQTKAASWKHRLPTLPSQLALRRPPTLPVTVKTLTLYCCSDHSLSIVVFWQSPFQGSVKESRLSVFSHYSLFLRMEKWVSHITVQFHCRAIILFKRVNTMQNSEHMETLYTTAWSVWSVIAPDQRVCWIYSCSRTGPTAPGLTQAKRKSGRTLHWWWCYCVIHF